MKWKAMQACLLTASVLSAPLWASEAKAAETASVSNYGAKPNDGVQDTAAIQAAINAVAAKGGGIVDIPAGTFDVAVNSGGTALTLKSNIHLRLNEKAVLKLAPNNRQVYRMISVLNVQNVKITGGTLIGDRDGHTGTGGEWGNGLHIMGSSSSISVEGVTSKNFWGDGFTIENNFDAVKKVPDGVTINNVVADNNRRQGLSIIAGRNITVTNSVFKNTNGTAPAAGIDLERDAPYTLPLEKVLISHNILENNAGYGLAFVYTNGNRAEYNVIRGNKKGGVYFGRSNSNTAHGNLIAGNGGDTSESYYSGGVFLNYSQNNTVSGNEITGSVTRGVYALNGVNGTKITGNKITNNKSVAIETYGGTGMTIASNHLSANGGTTKISSASSSNITNNGSSVAFTAPAEKPGLQGSTVAPASAPVKTVAAPSSKNALLAKKRLMLYGRN